jgi:crotonobetaine/carnitine-CoA ligase
MRPGFERHQTLPWSIQHWAGVDPDRPFLEQVGGPSHSYAEVHRSMLRWADAFSRLGIEPGENVPAMVPTSITAEEQWLGLAWMRAVQVGINGDFKGAMLAYVLENCAARTMVCSARYLDRVAAVVPSVPRLRRVIVPDAEGDLPATFPLELLRGEQVLAAAGTETTRSAPERHDIACVSYTSGTTGPSKGVLVPWGRFWPNATWTDLTGDDAYYCPFPVFHLSGMVPLAWLGAVGGRVVLRESFKTQSFWEDVRRHRCTATSLIPAMMNWLLDQPARPDDLDNPLRYVSGAPVIPRIEEFKARFGITMRTTYGNTECGTVFFNGPDLTERYQSMGPVAPGYQVRLVDDHDYDVAPGVPGEAIVRHDEPWAMNAGYFAMPDKTADAWRNGWFHTGDALRRDEDGFYYFVDRVKDSLRRRGENISSAEVEGLVNRHPAVAESAAIAVPSEHGEDEIKICVVLRDGHTLTHDEFGTYLEEALPEFMIPRYIEFLDLPERTEAMKRLLKPALRREPLNANTFDRLSGGRPR